MNSRKVVGLFFKTLFIGGIIGLLTSFFVKSEDYLHYLHPLDLKEISGLVLFFAGLGFISSVVSQTGFFAYLFINRFGLSLFRSYWSTLQLFLVAVVVFDLIYFPYKESSGDIPVYAFILMSFGILLYGILIAWIKASETKRRAFTPALFLMVVMTTVEWVPALRTNGTDYAWLMIVPLLACNTYQLLILHRLTNSPSASNKTVETETQAKKGKPLAHKKA